MDSKEFSTVVRKVTAERGIKHKAIAERLGITGQALSSKLQGQTKWSIDQASIVTKMLDLSDDVWR